MMVEKNGKNMEQITIAKRMLEENISIEIIIKVTGLTEKEILKLK